MDRSIWIGFDPHETAAFAVARHSTMRNLSRRTAVRGLVLANLARLGLYTRPMTRAVAPNGRPRLWDTISDAPMATEFAISRFLVPSLARSGWAMFMDADVLVRADLCRLFDSLDPRYAVYCVKHRHEPKAGIKMDGQIQTLYARKNWSSVMIFQASHPANQVLTVDVVNKLPGRDLHRFCWLDDSLIGELDPAWNYLVGTTDPQEVPEPLIIHFTDGTPDLPGFEAVEWADEWRAVLGRWAS